MENNLPINTLSLVMQIQDDGEDKKVNIILACNISDEMDEEYADYYVNMLHGMQQSVELMADHFAEVGAKTRIIDALMEASEQEGIVFEPADELLDAVHDTKVVAFNKKLHWWLNILMMTTRKS